MRAAAVVSKRSGHQSTVRQKMVGTARLRLRPPSAIRGTNILGIEPEMHHVAVGDDVFLAFQPQLAGVAGAGFAAERDVVVIGDGLGADEALLEIGVDDAGRRGALVPR